VVAWSQGASAASASDSAESVSAFKLASDTPLRFAAYAMSVTLLRCRCVRMVEVELAARKIVGFVISVPPSSQHVWYRLEHRYRPSIMHPIDVAAVQPIAAQLMPALDKTLGDGTAHTRLRVMALAIASWLHAQGSDAAAALTQHLPAIKLWLAHAWLLPRLPLGVRAQTLSAESDAVLLPILAPFHTALTPHLAQASILASVGAGQFPSFSPLSAPVRAAMLDLWDGRLVFTLAQLLWGNPGLLTQAQEVQAALTAIVSVAAPSAAASAVSLVPYSKGVEARVLTAVAALPPAIVTLEPVQPLYGVSSSFVSGTVSALDESLRAADLLWQPAVAAQGKEKAEVKKEEEVVEDDWESAADKDLDADDAAVADASSPVAASPAATRAQSRYGVRHHT
jgi:hypothetical protein